MFPDQTIVMVDVAMVMALVSLLVVDVQYQEQPVGIPWDCGVHGLVNGCLTIRLRAQLDRKGLGCAQQYCSFPRKHFVQLVELVVDVVMVVAIPIDNLVGISLAKGLDHGAKDQVLW